MRLIFYTQRFYTHIKDIFKQNVFKKIFLKRIYILIIIYVKNNKS